MIGDMTRNMTLEQMSSLVTSSLPDYTTRLDGDAIDQLRMMKYLNKLILFTTKEQAPPILRALSAKYKNRLLVCTKCEHENSLDTSCRRTRNWPASTASPLSPRLLSSNLSTTPQDWPSLRASSITTRESRGSTRSTNSSSLSPPPSDSQTRSWLVTIPPGHIRVEIFRKAIEEEKYKIPVLVPLVPANMTSVLSIIEPVVVYVSRQPEIPSLVRQIALKLKHAPRLIL